MEYSTSLAIEALVVGALLAAALVIGTRAFPPTTTRRTVVLGFVLGIVVHLAFEITKANQWYCAHGAACRIK